MSSSTVISKVHLYIKIVCFHKHSYKHCHIGPHMFTCRQSCNAAKYIDTGTFRIYKLRSCGRATCIYVCRSMKMKGTIMIIAIVKAHLKINKHYTYVYIKVYIYSFFLTELLLRSHGRYTKGQIERCARMCGGFGKEVDRLFALAGLGCTNMRPPKAQRHTHGQDVKELVAQYSRENLCSLKPGRKPSIPNFHRECGVRRPYDMGSKLKQLNTELDFLLFAQ